MKILKLFIGYILLFSPFYVLTYFQVESRINRLESMVYEQREIIMRLDSLANFLADSRTKRVCEVLQKPQNQGE
jgi:hypothetical protein